MLTDDQIKHMRDRFLGWSLPKAFNPDGGISFKQLSDDYYSDGMPSGTNLFNAGQAEQMIRYMLEGLK